ncbi:MAG: hypothetical protein ACXADH_11055, partial [Candidatus Kariarchaeaceae archaeon]
GQGQVAYAEAVSKRAVPTTTFTTGAGEGGSDYATGTDVQSFIDILTMKAARDLDLDVSIEKE